MNYLTWLLHKHALRVLLCGLLLTAFYALLLAGYFYSVRYADAAEWVQALTTSYYDAKAIGIRVFWAWLSTVLIGLIMGWQYAGGTWLGNLMTLMLSSLIQPWLLLMMTEDIDTAANIATLAFLPLQLMPALLVFQLCGWRLAVMMQRQSSFR